MERAIGGLPRVGKKEGEVRGNGFGNPLVAVARPADDVSPPLMGDFMDGNKVGESSLARGVQAHALLRFVRKKGKRGEIQEARPSLAKGSGDLRHAQVAKRERAAELFVKMNGSIDLARRTSAHRRDSAEASRTTT